MKILAIVLALFFIVLAVTAAFGLCSYVPAIGLDGTHHTKHAILYAILGVLSLVWYRFQNNAARA
jgi:hypothetical protein